MRQIVLDTETTGLDPADGHRIVEIGCVELAQRRVIGDKRWYVNPGRDSDPQALAVHGLTREFLADKPCFADIADELMALLRGAELLIHNAAFDVGFLDHELQHAGRAERVADLCTVTDTWELARKMHPGQKNGLDALCRRYEVDNSQRELHGALLDARLLADVYLAMTGGQTALTLQTHAGEDERGMGEELRALLARAQHRPLIVRQASDAECQAHAERLRAIEAKSRGCLWRDDLA